MISEGTRFPICPRLLIDNYCVFLVNLIIFAKDLKIYGCTTQKLIDDLFTVHYNDLVVAEALFQQATEPNAAYSFAAGWIAAEKNRMLKLVEQELRLFSQTKKLK